MDYRSLMGQASSMMLNKRHDDYASDRLNYQYTVTILAVFSIVNLNRLCTERIKCWVRLFLVILLR